MVGISAWRGRRLRILIAVVCGGCFSLFGYDQALYGGIAGGEAFIEDFKHPSASLTGHIAAVYDIGCLLGALMAVWITPKFGHRHTMLFGSAVVVVGAAIQTASVNVGMSVAGGIIGGIGNGINTSTTPVYHAELSKATSRGRAVLGFSFTTGGWQWRFPTAFQILYLLPVFFLVPLLPDSPRWLASNGNFEEAEAVLSQVLDEDRSSSTFQAQFQELKQVVELEFVVSETKISNLWKDEGQNMYRFLLSCSIQMMGQLSGVNVIAYYIVIIFMQQLHLEATLALILAACCGFVLLFSNLASQSVIERWGRRKLLIIRASGQTICFLVSAIVLKVGGNARWAGITVVSMIYLFCLVFAFAWQSIPYLYPAEIISLKYRARLFPIANGVNWAINYAIVLITPIDLQNIGWKFYMVFMVFNAISVIAVWFFYLETTKKSLEEVDLMFIGDTEVHSKELPPYLRLRANKQRPMGYGFDTFSKVGDGVNNSKNNLDQTTVVHRA